MLRFAWVLGIGVALTACQAPAPAGKLYVSNVLNNTVSVLDPAARRVTKKLPVGSLPHNFVFSDDRSRLYLTNTGSQSLSVIDTVRDVVLDEWRLGPLPDVPGHRSLAPGMRGQACHTCHQEPVGSQPAGMAKAPDGLSVVIAHLKSQELTRVELATGRVTQTVPLVYPRQPHPSNLLFHPERDEVYVLSRALMKAPGRLTVMDRKLRVKRHFEVIKQPYGLLVSPDGRELYIASRATNKVQVWNLDTWKLARTLISGDGPVGLYMGKTGKLYTADYYTSRPATMSVLDPRTGARLGTIEGVADLTCLAADERAGRLYVVNAGGSRVQAIDLKREAVVDEIPAGAFPLDIAFKPAPGLSFPSLR